MQAIITKFLPVTDTKGDRIKAKCFAGSIIVNWNYSLDPDENHKAAAQALINMKEWQNHLKILGQGSLPDNTGYAFVLGGK